MGAETKAIVKTSQQKTQKSGVTTLDISPDQFAKAALASGFYKDCKDLAAAYVKMSLGASLGIDPATAMDVIIVINGRVSYKSSFIAARLKSYQNGKYRYLVKHKDDKRCVIEVHEKVEQWTDDAKQFWKWELIGTETFTIDMAKRAGLTKNPAWSSFTEALLFARCITAAARTHAPDAFMGQPCYTPDELEPNAKVVVNDDGLVDVVLEESSQETATPKKTGKGGKSDVVPDAEIVAEVKSNSDNAADEKSMRALTDLISSLSYDPAPLLKYHGKKRLEDLTQDEVNYSVGILEQKKRAPK